MSGALTRRALLARGLLAAGGLAAAPLLEACAGSPTGPANATSPRTGPAGATGPTGDRSTATGLVTGPEQPGGLLRIAAPSALVAPGFVRAFQYDTGVTIDTDDLADEAAWMVDNRRALSGHTDPGADLVVVTDVTAHTLIDRGWVSTLEPDNLPNRTHLRPELATVALDPRRRHSLPLVAGIAGLAYDPTRVATPPTTVADLFDPQYKGRVTMLADFRDGLGMVMAAAGDSPTTPTQAAVTRAVEQVATAHDAGQIARFTSPGDAFTDLTSGAVAIAQVRSGDLPRLRVTAPTLAFAIPAGGSTLFADDMVLPVGGRNRVAGEAWMNWLYEPRRYATLIAPLGATSVQAGLADDLARIDPALATDPVVNPSEAVLARLAVWAPLRPAVDARYAQLYATVTG